MSIGFIIGIVITIIGAIFIAMCERLAENCSIKECISIFWQSFVVIGLIILGLIGCIYLFNIAFPTNQGEVIEKEYNIYGLEYKTEINSYSQGYFILGSGTYSSGSDTKNYYYFFSENEYGKKLEKLNGTEYPIYIKESDDEEPNLKTIYQVRNWNDWRKTLFGNNEEKIIVGRILTVPTNTIQIEYNVDI